MQQWIVNARQCQCPGWSGLENYDVLSAWVLDSAIISLDSSEKMPAGAKIWAEQIWTAPEFGLVCLIKMENSFRKFCSRSNFCCGLLCTKYRLGSNKKRWGFTKKIGQINKSRFGWHRNDVGPTKIRMQISEKRSWSTKFSQNKCGNNKAEIQRNIPISSKTWNFDHVWVPSFGFKKNHT